MSVNPLGPQLSGLLQRNPTGAEGQAPPQPGVQQAPADAVKAVEAPGEGRGRGIGRDDDKGTAFDVLKRTLADPETGDVVQLSGRGEDGEQADEVFRQAFGQSARDPLGDIFARPRRGPPPVGGEAQRPPPSGAEGRPPSIGAEGQRPPPPIGAEGDRPPPPIGAEGDRPPPPIGAEGERPPPPPAGFEGRPPPIGSEGQPPPPPGGIEGRPPPIGSEGQPPPPPGGLEGRPPPIGSEGQRPPTGLDGQPPPQEPAPAGPIEVAGPGDGAPTAEGPSPALAEGDGLAVADEGGEADGLAVEGAQSADGTEEAEDAEEARDTPEAGTGDELTPEEEQVVQQLQARDREVKAHEQAHKAVGGQYAGAISYDYQTGPDGKRYAVGGEVPIDISEIPGDPAATIRKMDVVRRAALAPAQPSGQDRSVAATASQIASRARVELAELQAQEVAEARGDATEATEEASEATEAAGEGGEIAEGGDAPATEATAAVGDTPAPGPAPLGGEAEADGLAAASGIGAPSDTAPPARASTGPSLGPIQRIDGRAGGTFIGRDASALAGPVGQPTGEDGAAGEASIAGAASIGQPSPDEGIGASIAPPAPIGQPAADEGAFIGASAPAPAGPVADAGVSGIEAPAPAEPLTPPAAEEGQDAVRSGAASQVSGVDGSRIRRVEPREGGGIFVGRTSPRSVASLQAATG